MELLAPAGSRQALTAAVQSGADAVYLGGPQFGARYSAENFTIEEMKTWVDYCHLYGVDVHVTVNTLVKEKEIDKKAVKVAKTAEKGIKKAGNKLGEVAGEIVAGYKSKAGGASSKASGTSSKGRTAPDIIVDAKDITEHSNDEGQ